MAEARPIVLITGASAGIGTALAKTFARHGHELLLVARRETRLVELADAIAASGVRRPHVAAIDLEQHGGVEAIAAVMERLGVEPEVVVNNAGFGLLGRAAELSRAEQLAMIDLNVRALTDLSLAFLAPLQRRRGGLLNVASVAAFLPGPGMAVYYATKAYVLSFSEALHWEMRRHGVRVTTLCPGPVPTEFQHRAGFSGSRVPSLLTMSAEQVAEIGFRALQRGQRLAVPGAMNRLTTLLTRFLPRRALLASVSRFSRSQQR